MPTTPDPACPAVVHGPAPYGRCICPRPGPQDRAETIGRPYRECPGSRTRSNNSRDAAGGSIVCGGCGQHVDVDSTGYLVKHERRALDPGPIPERKGEDRREGPRRADDQRVHLARELVIAKARDLTAAGFDPDDGAISDEQLAKLSELAELVDVLDTAERDAGMVVVPA